MKVEEQKRKAKFDFGLYCLEFCPLFTLAISRAIHVIWTHPSILSYPNIVLCRDEIFPLVSRFPLFDQNIWKQNMSNLLQTAKKWNFRVVYGWPLSWLFTHEYMEQALGNIHLVWMTRPVHCFSSINIIVIT